MLLTYSDIDTAILHYFVLQERRDVTSSMLDSAGPFVGDIEAQPSRPVVE